MVALATDKVEMGRELLSGESGTKNGHYRHWIQSLGGLECPITEFALNTEVREGASLWRIQERAWCKKTDTMDRNTH